MNVWWIRDNKLGIASLSGSTFTTLSSGGDTLRIYYSKSSTDIADVPSQYHDGIISRVMEKISVKNENYSGAQYYTGQWANALRMGKAEANSGKDGAPYEIKGYDY